MSKEISRIEEFFKCQTVFLTGGNGFLGKVLIEKLLYQCKDLKKIYVLMRPKKGKTPEQRFEELFNFPCFDRLKSENAAALKKVSLVIGDCKEPNLGIVGRDLMILKKETTCVIHAAANVKFDQTLKEATGNVRGTKEVLNLAKEMSCLRVLVYISTAYSNCIHPTIQEKFYEPPMKADVLFRLVDEIDDESLNIMTPKLLGKWPNTYVYTKSISEDLVKQASHDLPIAIVRPVIVASSKDEPMPGWVDNFYGPIGIVVGGGLGVIRCAYVNVDVNAYIVPVDYVSNLILASAWKRENSDTTQIYNYVGPLEDTVTWGYFDQKLREFYWNNVPSKAIWYRSLITTKHLFLYNILVFFRHTLMSYFIDLILLCCGKSPLAVQGYRRLNKSIMTVSYFNARNWIFHNDNVEKLWNDMTPADKNNFYFSMKNFDWHGFLMNASRGGRIYLLKDPIDTLPKAIRRMKFLAVAHYTLAALFYYLVYKMICLVFSLFW